MTSNDIVMVEIHYRTGIYRACSAAGLFPVELYDRNAYSVYL